MRIQLLSSLFLFSFSSFIYRVSTQPEHASFPPRGWNSYDSFDWILSEVDFLQSAEKISQRLQPYGYEYAVVDYLWYRKNVPGAHPDSLGFDVIDEWGRLIPDPDRWPSSEDGKGFTEVAQKVQSVGLKFGIHVMRGLSRQAYDANTPILDTTTGRAYEESGRLWRAKDIGITERACGWMPHGFMSVNTKLGAGRAFLRSLYEQYAEWGVDFVKHDCVFGNDLDVDEITFVSEVLQKLNRPILYSVSPGVIPTPVMAKDISGLVNMYRVTGDDWDKWGDVAAHFDVSRWNKVFMDFAAANKIGAKGLLGKSWPDLDMLPVGWLTDPGSGRGPYRMSNLNLDEQKTQMTLWAMARSPIMYGGDVRRLDETTSSLITNPFILEINSFSTNNMEFPFVTGTKVSAHKTTNHSRRSRRSLKEVGTSHTQFLGFTSCSHPKVNGWSIKALDQDLDQICWKESMRSHEPLCLYKRKPLLTSSDAKQMWELSNNGSLISSYSGLCVSVKSIDANVGNSGGVRSWIATGRKGEIYVALFNLNSEKTVTSATISDLTKALPGRNLKATSCHGREVWSGKDFGEIKDSISMELEMHGCALFALNCP
ncbi:PREDICTED: alpha-galactosidase-like isoform X3 [Populus euphratica]|uniref:Alpha-galactosidase n=1 Tax=Populus euphratica TaxID=75702 RepID=A0AAJ6V723_POPEU|nr:PREDICTED: alpha-galactosidase-like isoform X3 [Populus euphratica]